MMQRAPVNKIIPFSAVDGPGNRTAVFVQGCTFDCRYCHNPETIRMCVGCGACVSVCPTGALTLNAGEVRYDWKKCALCDACIRRCQNCASPRIRMMNAEEVMAEVRKNVPFIRGVTVSGGECTLQRDFLLELADLARREQLGVLLDSNGSYDFSVDAALVNAVDGVMLDVKAWDAREHVRLTGVSNECVLSNLRFLAGCGKLEEVRTVIVPDMMNSEQTVARVSEALCALGASDVRYKIIRFRPMGVRAAYQALTVPTDAQMQRLEAIARETGMTQIVLI